MSLKWIDSLDLAIALDETHPDIDPNHLNFVDLQKMILALDEFDDDPARCGERILEAVTMAWIDEKD